jgi:hypothetical protein
MKGSPEALSAGSRGTLPNGRVADNTDRTSESKPEVGACGGASITLPG